MTTAAQLTPPGFRDKAIPPTTPSGGTRRVLDRWQHHRPRQYTREPQSKTGMPRYSPTALSAPLRELHAHRDGSAPPQRVSRQRPASRRRCRPGRAHSDLLELPRTRDTRAVDAPPEQLETHTRTPQRLPALTSDHHQHFRPSRRLQAMPATLQTMLELGPTGAALEDVNHATIAGERWKTSTMPPSRGRAGVASPLTCGYAEGDAGDPGPGGPADTGMHCRSRFVRLWGFWPVRGFSGVFRLMSNAFGARPTAVSCRWCGQHVRNTVRGPIRRWCSEACRLKSYRVRRRSGGTGVRRGG
jgi:hypothetical protein